MSFVTNYYVQELPVWPEARTAQPQTAGGFNHSSTGTVTQPSGAILSPVPFPDAPDTGTTSRTANATAAGNVAIAQLTGIQAIVATQLTAVGALLPAATTTLTTVAPTSGTVGGGTALTLTGTGFVAPVTVSIGGRTATSIVLVSATSITCVAPPGFLKGITGITVTGANGNAYKANSFTYT